MVPKFHGVIAAGLCCAGSVFAQDALPPAATQQVDYVKDILPLFEQFCMKCHGPEKPKSGLRMDNATDFMKGGTEGPAFIAGDSANSLLVQLLVGAHPDYDIMPPKGDPMNAEQVGLVRAWIDQGAKMPEGGAPAAAAPAVENGPESQDLAGMPGWKVEATAQQGPLATWEVSATVKGPNGESVIALTKPNHTSAGTFNLCWSPEPATADGVFSASVQANGGEEDQGGGIAWRIKDKNNYYVARFNPLEKNLRAYKVVDGKRDQLASADIEIAEPWAALVVEQTGNAYKVSLNGQALLSGEDASLPAAGGAGFWTKADAATSFTALKVEKR